MRRLFGKNGPQARVVATAKANGISARTPARQRHLEKVEERLRLAVRLHAAVFRSRGITSDVLAEGRLPGPSGLGHLLSVSDLYFVADVSQCLKFTLHLTVSIEAQPAKHE